MIPPSYPSHTFRAIHTVVAASQREALDAARILLRDATVPGVNAEVRHFDSPDELWTTYPFQASATVVLDVSLLRHARASGRIDLPRSTLSSFVSAWDHSLLLCSPDDLTEVESIVRTTLTSRVHLLPREVVDARWYAGVLQALWSRSTTVSRSLSGAFTDDTYGLLGRLPVDMQRWVLPALAAPLEWNAQQLADACGVSPRTLERRFAEVGLASPGRLLQIARTRAHAHARARPTGSVSPE